MSAPSYYLEAADQRGWTTRQLRGAIKAGAFGGHTDQPWAVPPDEDPHQVRVPQAHTGPAERAPVLGCLDHLAPEVRIPPPRGPRHVDAQPHRAHNVVVHGLGEALGQQGGGIAEGHAATLGRSYA